MSKFTRRELHSLQDFLDTCDGGVCCSLDDWSTGHGRYKRTRTLPPFVYKVSMNDMHQTLSPTACRSARNWLYEHERRIWCLCLDTTELLNFIGEHCLGKEM